MIMGLPLHPLVVHFAVVLVPLAFVSLLAVVAVKRWRERYSHLALILTVAAALFAVIARFSGGQLASMAGGVPSGHAFWGNLLMYAALATAALALLWFFMIRKEQDAAANTVLGWLSVAAAGVAMVMTMLAGHTGAESVWGTLNTAANNGEATATEAPATATEAPATTVDAPASSADVPSSAAGAAVSLTMDEVASHNTAESCYAVVEGTVYDLTDWIAKHPGGAGAIEKLCGTDATEAFAGVHGGNEKAEYALEQFAVGTLAK